MRIAGRLVCVALGLALLQGASAQTDGAVEFSRTQISEKIWMLQGAGGNIAAFVGSDGVLLVDDSFDRFSESLEAALREIGGDLPHYVLNTHFHGDHTGGNAALGREGHIIAHVNTRARLIEVYNAPQEALPEITYTDEFRVHFNDELVRVVHLPCGHTDGDSIVWFVGSNVVHLGDLLFSGRFPYIDLGNGGSFEGVLANLRKVLELLPASIDVIPGHGPASKLEDVSRTIEMFEATSAEVRAGLDAGLSIEAIIERGLSNEWEEWGWAFINEERWIRTLAESFSTGSGG